MPSSTGSRRSAGHSDRLAPNSNGMRGISPRSPWDSGELSTTSSTDGDLRSPLPPTSAPHSPGAGERGGRGRVLYAPHPQLGGPADQINSGLERRSMSPGEIAQFEAKTNSRRKMRDPAKPKKQKNLSTLERSILGLEAAAGNGNHPNYGGSPGPTSDPTTSSYINGYFAGGSNPGSGPNSPTPPAIGSPYSIDAYDSRDAPSSFSSLFGNSSKPRHKHSDSRDGSTATTPSGYSSSCANSLSGYESNGGGSGTSTPGKKSKGGMLGKFMRAGSRTPPLSDQGNGEWRKLP